MQTSRISAVGCAMVATLALGVAASPSDATGLAGTDAGSTPATESFLDAVAAVSADDVWAGGGTADGPLVGEWDGSVWTPVAAPSPGSNATLWGVSASAADDAWAVGYYVKGRTRRPLAIHWDGTSWTSVPLPRFGHGASLFGVSAVSATDAWLT